MFCILRCFRLTSNLSGNSRGKNIFGTPTTTIPPGREKCMETSWMRLRLQRKGFLCGQIISLFVVPRKPILLAIQP